MMIEINETYIAPCGMNCRLCMANQREKNKCNGCRNESAIQYKTKGSNSCVIKNCPVILSSSSGFCYECSNYPCQRLKQLDKRYQGKYHMSMLKNLDYIGEFGIDAFLHNEENRWKCRTCGNIVCVHKHMCLECKTPIRN
jgi:hypothetical protein